MKKIGEKAMSKSQKFLNWFDNRYIPNLDENSDFYRVGWSDNWGRIRRMRRIAFTGVMLIENPNISIEELRKRTALKYFISMRTALDTINYSKMLIELWKKDSSSNTKLVLPPFI